MASHGATADFDEEEEDDSVRGDIDEMQTSATTGAGGPQAWPTPAAVRGGNGSVGNSSVGKGSAAGSTSVGVKVSSAGVPPMSSNNSSNGSASFRSPFKANTTTAPLPRYMTAKR